MKHHSMPATSCVVLLIITLVIDLLSVGPGSIRRLYAWLAARVEARRWLDTPAGCCECGTGGPYYRGDGPQVTRHLYTGATADSPAGSLDWSACSRHPIDSLTPLVDYGTDVVVTFRQTESDAAAAMAARRTDGGAS